MSLFQSFSMGSFFSPLVHHDPQILLEYHPALQTLEGVVMQLFHAQLWTLLLQCAVRCPQQTLASHPRMEKPLSLKVCSSVSGRSPFSCTTELSLTFRQACCQGCKSRACSVTLLQPYTPSGSAMSSLSSVYKY